MWLIVGWLLGQGRREENEKLKEELALAQNKEEADKAAFEADWQAEMEKARRGAEELREDATFYETKAQEGFDLSTDQLAVAYGEGGSEWAGYENLVLQNVSTRGGMEASAGASGLKNAGSVAGVRNQYSALADRSEATTRRAIETGMDAGITQTTQALRDARFQIGKMREEAAQTETDWAGFNWQAFVTGSQFQATPAPAAPATPSSTWPPRPMVDITQRAGGSRTNPSYLQKLYASRGDVMAADWEMTESKYRSAIDDTSDSFWNVGKDLIESAKFGLNIAAMFA